LLGSSTGLSPEFLGPVLANQVETRPGEVMTLAHGGGGAVTRMVCGFLTAQDILEESFAFSATTALQGRHARI
jgi:hypothetical protein